MSLRDGWRGILRHAGAAAGVLLLATETALAARRAESPNYALPYVIAVVMCVTMLAIPCKRFRRT